MTDTTDMIHEDRLPGHESQAPAQTRMAAALPGIGPARGHPNGSMIVNG